MKALLLYSMIVFYVVAGTNHFWHPKPYKKIIPPFLPYPTMLVYLSGLCEILFGLLLVRPATRPLGAWLIIALLVAVFPANIQMAMKYYSRDSPYFWLAMLRLPFQLVLIFWAWQFTGLV